MIEEKLHYTFADKRLLKAALTHPSYERGKRVHEFERLEFIGDRVLNLVVAQWVYEKYKTQNEGMLAQKLSALISRETCHSVGVELDLISYLKANFRDYKSTNSSILSNTLEAVLGAMYLDGGLEPCDQFIRKYWKKYFQTVGKKDPKSTVQEWVQKKLAMTPTYKILEETGPAHSPVFTIELFVSDKLRTTGTGPSKKQAEQDAAEKFMAAFITKG